MDPLTKGLPPKTFIGHVERMSIMDKYKSLLTLSFDVCIYMYCCNAHIV